MSDFLFIDLETRSAVDLKKRGSYVYWESPTSDVLMARYAFDDGPVLRWLRGDPVPDCVREHVEKEGRISGWNVFGFERLAFDAVLGPRYGWPVPKLEQYDDTMHMAAAMSLPLSLDMAGHALNLPVQKDKEGARLIRKFSVPRKPRKDEPPGLYWNEPDDHPEDFQKFIDYCGVDVETERAARKRLVPLSDYERQVTILDARINSRGVRIDWRSAHAAVLLAKRATAQLDREMTQLTGGYVTACSQVSKLTAWLETRGAPMGSLAKADLLDALKADDLPPEARRALELRRVSAKTSVAKLESMVERSGRDGRARGTFSYHRAGTGRWQNTGINLLNMPRPRKEYEEAHLDTAVLFEAFRLAQPDLLPMLYGDDLGRPLHMVSDSIRGFVWAAPGHDLVQADFSGIEGAVIAWLADEKWKLAELRAIIDDPSRPDMYRQTAARILNLSTDVVTKKHWARQAVGKVSELALGYQGGVSAFYSMSRLYNVELDPLFGPIWEITDAEHRDKAVGKYESAFKRKLYKTDELSREAWLACEIIKTGWREQNSAIAQAWKDLEAAIRAAVADPGSIHGAAKVKYRLARGFLWCMLPSGRCLAYGAPKLKDQVWARVLLPDGSWSDAEVMDRQMAEIQQRRGTVKIVGPTSPAVTILGVDSVTKKWARMPLYGGLAAENITQATARDILVNGMFKVEAAGYPIVMHVYDEAVAEVPAGFGSVAEFERLLCDLPAWADGLPLTAGGWRGKRYRKE